MNRCVLSLLAALLVAPACHPSVDTGLVPSRAAVLENQLMQADRDFATATQANGIDGWMSYYTPDAVRIVYGGGMVKGLDGTAGGDGHGIPGATSHAVTQQKTPYPFRYGAGYWWPTRPTSAASSTISRASKAGFN